MSTSFHRGYCIQSDSSREVWHVRIKKHVLSGSLPAVKKSIDWWCDASMLINPDSFASLLPAEGDKVDPQQEDYNNYILKNDLGEKDSWYCFVNGQLVKGSQTAIKKYIDKQLATLNNG